MAFLPKAIYRSNAIPINIPSKCSTDLYRTINNFIGKNNKPKVGKTIIYKKGTSEGLTISDIKLYYRATVMKTALYWNETEMLTSGIRMKT